MKSLLTGLLAGLLVIAGVVIWLQHQAQQTLSADNGALTEANNQLRAETLALSNRVAAAASAPAQNQAQMSELLKLRGEVGLLRNQAGQAAQMRAENQQLQARANAPSPAAPPAEITPEDLFMLKEMHVQNAMKQLALAMKIYAGDNADKFATNFDQMKDLIGTTNFAGNVGLDDIEFMNAGVVNDAMPEVIIFRERAIRAKADGRLHRIYGLADGSVRTITGGNNSGEDADFAEYEKQHSPPRSQ